MKTLDKSKMGIAQSIEYIEDRLSASIYAFKMSTAFGVISVREETEDYDPFHPVEVYQSRNNATDFRIQIGYAFNPEVRHMRIVEAMQRIILTRVMPNIEIPQEVVDALTIAYMTIVENRAYPEQDICDELLMQAGFMAKIDPMTRAITERYVSGTVEAALRCGREASSNAIMYGRLRGIPESDQPYYTMMIYGIIEMMIPGTIKPLPQAARPVAIYQRETVICY